MDETTQFAMFTCGEGHQCFPVKVEHELEVDVPLPPAAEMPLPNTIDSSATPVTDGAKYAFMQRRARCVARNPWIHFNVAMGVALTLSVIGMVVGNFTVSVDNAGWQSRGTLIADRQTQMSLALYAQKLISQENTDAVWDNLLNNVQSGWETVQTSTRRNLGGQQSYDASQISSFGNAYPAIFHNPQLEKSPSIMRDDGIERNFQTSQQSGSLQDCDVGWYSDGRMFNEEHLWPIWKTKSSSISVLDSQVLRDVCIAEETTQKILEENGLCFGCSGNRCLPPYSIVLFARFTLDSNFNMSCEELATNWEGYAQTAEKNITDCADALNSDTFTLGNTLPESCPFGISPTFLDRFFGSNNAVNRYSSSIFASNVATDQVKAMYDIAGKFDRASASKLVAGTYDTQVESFVNYQVDAALYNDMILALGSAVVTTVAMIVHTRSAFLTLIGLVQIIISFPISYFFYTIIGRLEFFPFLNFIGVFVVFALGADDVFVAVDKWKNARLANKNGSVEDIAAAALPDAAFAMFLTSITTAVAFFGTAICPVAPLKCFAIFCGLLVSFEYIMCVLLVLPALCIYDNRNRHGRNCFFSCHFCHKSEEHSPDIDGEEAKPSLIKQILTSFYNGLHFIRWPLFVACFAALGVCIYYAMKLQLPNSSDVRLLDPKRSQYETNFEWRLNLLFDTLNKKGGSQGFVAWGLSPADTGNHNDPNTWSQLKLDNSFDPSSIDAQLYLASFCDNLLSTDFASKTDVNYNCSINNFDIWLQEQANSTSPTDIYLDKCNGTAGLPVPEAIFNPCFSTWAMAFGDTTVLSRNGIVEIMYFEFQCRVRYDSPYDTLDKEWHLIESWMSNERAIAPSGVNALFHSSEDFWWYDTNGQMLYTAYGSAAIAVGAAAFVVLFSSRSIMLTLFALITIMYILTATTAMLVASGWTLGFLEAICFAILIGVSCDFVLHFGYSYASLKGDVDRHERSKHALITMGPSILAGAFTTICAALIMLFCVITFFQRFATILFYTILQATVASFVFFLTLTDTIGPSQPTYLADQCALRLSKVDCKEKIVVNNDLEKETALKATIA